MRIDAERDRFALWPSCFDTWVMAHRVAATRTQRYVAVDAGRADAFLARMFPLSVPRPASAVLLVLQLNVGATWPSAARVVDKGVSGSKDRRPALDELRYDANIAGSICSYRGGWNALGGTSGPSSSARSTTGARRRIRHPR